MQSVITDRTWELVECDNSERTGMFREIINNYHKYMKYKDTCNRRINYLVYYKGELTGAFGVNSAILSLSSRDNWLGWNKEQRLKHINQLCNNYRFCMMKEGLPSSQLLSVAVKVVKKRWEEKYSDPLIMIESLVKPPFTGSIYKAAGWIYVGMTKGFSFSKAPLKSWQKETSTRGELARTNPKAAIEKYAVGGKSYDVVKSEPKLVFIRPLVPNIKQLLLAEMTS